MMRRREFVAGLAGVARVAACRARAAAGDAGDRLFEQRFANSDTSRLTGLRRGLNETGYVEGRNLVVEYRWAGTQFDRLPALAVDLVQIRVAVIVSPGLPATLRS